MRCISRIIDDTYSQKFGDGYHKFYVEMRCNMPCTESICSRCSKSECKTQHSRKFDHGTINDPIPDISHIYGSKWYNDSIKKYGEPTKEVIEFAEKYRREARDQCEARKEAHQQEPEPKPKRTRPKVAKVRKKETPYSSLVNTAPLVYKEVTLPTHIETKLEDIDTDGFTIEYVKVIPFEHNGSTYFKDTKNKLYKKIKDKIGPYIGRFNPENNSIADIPDSDDES